MKVRHRIMLKRAVLLFSMTQPPSEVQAKSVGEVVLAWNTELESRTNFFKSKAKSLAEWDRHILKNRHQLMALQVDLGKASTSQDRLERQLDILQVHQKQISEALNVMEAEAEHLCRSPQHSTALESQTSSSQETLYSLAESISAHLSSLGDALHEIVPSNADGEEEFNRAAETSAPNSAFPSEVLKAHLQTLHSIEQKISHASAALR